MAGMTQVLPLGFVMTAKATFLVAALLAPGLAGKTAN